MHIGQQKHCCLYRPKWPGTSLCVAARPPVLRSSASTPVSLSWLACPNFRLFCRGHRPENPRGPQPIVAFEGGPFCYRTVQRSSRSCHSGRFSIILSKKYVVFFPTKSLQYFHESQQLHKEICQFLVQQVLGFFGYQCCSFHLWEFSKNCPNIQLMQFHYILK